jgi:hypothetical protein
LKEVDLMSQEYKIHDSHVKGLLVKGDQTNANLVALQKETISMRVNENASITKAMQESQRNIAGFEV